MLSLKTQTLLDLAIDSMKADLMVQIRRAGEMKGLPCKDGMQEFIHYLGIYRTLVNGRLGKMLCEQLKVAPDEEAVQMPDNYCTHMD